MQFDPSLYYPVYIYSLLVLSIFYSLGISQENTGFILNKSNNKFYLIYIGLFLVLVGLRPISGYYFGDTANYALDYSFYENGKLLDPDAKEYVFAWLMYQSAKIMDVHGFYLLVEFLSLIHI